MNGFICLIEVDITLSKILYTINENASKEFLLKTQTNYSLNYLKYSNINNNYNETSMKNYILSCLINCLLIPTINFIDYGQYLYIYLTDIKDPFKKNQLIIKVGFASNLENRYTDLKKSYKSCSFYLLGFRKINGIFDEKKFHKHIKNKYKNLFIPLKKNKKLNSFTDETYFLHPLIMAEAVDYIVNLPNQLEIQQEKTKQIEMQEKTKQIEMQEKTKQIELQTKQIELQTKQKIIEEKSKQMELQIKKIELKKTKII